MTNDHKWSHMGCKGRQPKAFHISKISKCSFLGIISAGGITQQAIHQVVTQVEPHLAILVGRKWHLCALFKQTNQLCTPTPRHQGELVCIWKSTLQHPTWLYRDSPPSLMCPKTLEFLGTYLSKIALRTECFCTPPLEILFRLCIFVCGLAGQILPHSWGVRLTPALPGKMACGHALPNLANTFKTGTLHDPPSHSTLWHMWCHTVLHPPSSHMPRSHSRSRWAASSYLSCCRC